MSLIQQYFSFFEGIKIIAGPVGCGKSTLANSAMLYRLQHGGRVAVNSIGDIDMLYKYLRKIGGLTKYEALEAVNIKLTVVKSWDDLAATKSALVVLDEAQEMIGKQYKKFIPISGIREFSQIRKSVDEREKYRPCMLILTQGHDNIEPMIKDSINEIWEAEQIQYRLGMKMLTPFWSAINVARGKSFVDHVYEYTRIQIAGNSTGMRFKNIDFYKKSLNTFRMPSDEYQRLCFNSFKRLSTAISDQIDAEMRLEQMRKFAMGESVPTSSCKRCGGVGEVYYSFIGAGEWVPVSRKATPLAFQSDCHLEKRECDTCQGKGYYFDYNHPEYLTALEMSERYGWKASKVVKAASSF